MKLSEKSRMHLRSSLTGHRTGTFSVHFGLHMAPNPRSERCSNHFSDSFVTEFYEVAASGPQPCRLVCSAQRINGRWSVPVNQDRCDLICIDAPRAEAIRERLLSEEASRDAAERAKALSDPTRLTLAEALRAGEELCVCDLSWIAGRSQNLVSH